MKILNLSQARLIACLLIFLPFFGFSTIIEIPKVTLRHDGSSPVHVNATAEISAPLTSDVYGDLTRKGVITLGVDHHYPLIVAEAHTDIELLITPYTTVGGSAGTPFTIQLSVDYFPNSQLEFKDKHIYELDNVLAYDIELTSVNGTSADLPHNLYIDVEMFVDRVYDFSYYLTHTLDVSEANNKEKIDTDCDNVTDYFSISWTPIKEAESYQVEWTYVNDYTDEDGVYKATTDIPFDFKNNSSRISTSTNEFRIPATYDHGYILYRVRAVGRHIPDPTRRLYSPWSAQETGVVSNVSSFAYAITEPWEEGINWQYSVTFAEEAKRKEVVSFYDGSLRNRQMVTLISSNNKAIVGETIYDHQGRPAIQVLPVPAVGPVDCEDGVNSLKYYKGFNRNEYDYAYNRTDFDTSDIPCGTTVRDMNNNWGASHYYSSQNAENTLARGYLPEANNYPFSQVEYTPDNTGRIRRQGGVGAEFQLGSEHESKYFYGHPAQIELDRLFGAEVGCAAHYQKNMVMDPNGQVSVSYLDQEGRVIATSLAGTPAENTIALDSYELSGVQLTDLIVGAAGSCTSEETSPDGLSQTVTETILISAPTLVTINYSQEIDKFTDTCLAEDICFGCIYDLTIQLKDECGKSMLLPEDTTRMTGHFEYFPLNDSIAFAMDCSAEEMENIPVEITVNLGIGSYQLSKTLSINEEALAYYEEQYLNPEVNTCFKTLEDFEEEYLANADFSGCFPDSTCTQCMEALPDPEDFVTSGAGTASDYQLMLDQCEGLCKPPSLYRAYRDFLLMDVRPGGQYAEYMMADGTIYPEQYQLSIFKEVNLLPHGGNWQSPVYIDDAGSTHTKYFDADLTTESRVKMESITYNVGETAIESSIPALTGTSLTLIEEDPITHEWYTFAENLTVEAFIQEYKTNPSWAHSLMYYHPEYNILKTYRQLTEEYLGFFSSESFDALMETTNTWQEAIDNEFVKPGYAGFPQYDRLYDFASPSTSHAYDPFLTDISDPTVWTDVKDDFQAELDDYMGSGFTIEEFAAMTNRCGEIGSTPTSGCYNFGSGTTAEKDADWVRFKAFYRGLKQEYISRLNLERAINETDYYGYNGCIQCTEPFNPTANGFFPQHLNPEQPCKSSTAALYATKKKRFLLPSEANGVGDGSSSFTGTPEEINAETEEAVYLNTGNCPLSVGLMMLCSEMLASGDFDNSAFDLRNNQGFAAFINAYAPITPPAPLPEMTWNTFAPNDYTMEITIVDAFSNPVAEISFIQDPLDWIDWVDMIGFSGMMVTGTGGLGYEFTGKYISSIGSIIEYDTIIGSTDLDILNCTFPDNCTLNQLGVDLFNLMGVLSTTEHFLDTIPYTLMSPGCPCIYSSFVTTEISNVLTASAGSTIKWEWDGSSAFTISDTSLPYGIELQILNYSGLSCDLADIAGFAYVEAAGENTFNLTAVDEYGNVLCTLEVLAGQLLYPHGYSPLQIANCEEVSLGCNEPGQINAADLEALLADVLENQDPDYNLFDSSYLTENLENQFTGGSSSSNTVTVSYLGFSRETTTFTIGMEHCDLVLTRDILGAGYDLEDIESVDNFEIVGSLGDDGFFHEFELIVTMNNGTTSESQSIRGEICIPLLPCEPVEHTFNPSEPFPNVIITDPCTAIVTAAAYAAAEEAYNLYADTLLTEFRANYIAHCMSTVQSFGRTYNQKEYHFTLYYYDQAGNLVKTVPPEGVEPLPITSNNDALAVDIEADRTNGTHTVITNHRMATLYAYNSLNQLVAQHMPDMDDMSAWDQNLPSGLHMNLQTTAMQMVDEANGYLTGFVTSSNSPTGSRGYFYKTTDGGNNWDRIKDLFVEDLVKVRMVDVNTGFAVANVGIVLMTKDGGSTWDLMNLHGVGVIGDFVDVAAYSASNAAFLRSDGAILKFTGSALSGTLYTPAVSGHTLNAVTSIEPLDGSADIYLLSAQLTYSGESFTRMLKVNLTSTGTTTVEQTMGSAWSAVGFSDSHFGMVGGADGDLVLLTEDGTGSGTQTLYSSGDNVGKILETIFLDENLGVAIIENASAERYLYKTTNHGLNWTGVDNAKQCKGITKTHTNTNLYVVALMDSSGTAKLKHYEITSSANTTLWTYNATATMLTNLASYYINGRCYVAGYYNNKVYSTSSFVAGSTTKPTALNTYYTYTSGSAPTRIRALNISTSTTNNMLHIVLVRNDGSNEAVEDLYSLNGAAATKKTLSPASTTFKDAVIYDEGTTSFILAYNHGNSKIYKVSIGMSAPTSASLASFTNNTSNNLPTTSAFVAMALNSGYVTLVGSDGQIYNSTTAISSSTTTATLLSWIGRTDLRLSTINDITRTSYTISSYDYKGAAVGIRGVVLRRNATLNNWNIVPAGKTNNLRGASYAYVSPVPYVYVIADNVTSFRLSMSTNTSTSVSYSAPPTGIFTDISTTKTSTGAFGIISANNGYTYYTNAIDAGSPTFTRSSAFESYEIKSISFAPVSSGTPIAISVGAGGKISQVNANVFTHIDNVFGPALNSVHFDGDGNGTVAGAYFFVRSTTNSGTTWNKIFPNTISPAELSQEITAVWTRPTTTQFHAVLGGNDYVGQVHSVTAVGGVFGNHGLVRDIKFDAANPNHGYIAQNKMLYHVQLTAAGGGTYSSAYTAALASSPVLPADINAIHVFNGSGSDNSVMMAGNNMMRYKEEGSMATISMLSGIAGNIKDVTFADSKNGYAVGNNGQLYHTDVVTFNSSGTLYTGMSWLAQDVSDVQMSGMTFNITEVEFPSVTHGVIAGHFTTTNVSGYAALRVLGIENQLYSSKFYYDRLGRIVVSQNSRQKEQDKFSYTLYDELGRVYEAGEKLENGSSLPQFASIFGTSVGGQYITSVIDDTKLDTWITTSGTTTRREVTTSYYDKYDETLVENGLDTYYNFNEATQRKRIVHVTYEERYDDNVRTYNHATHYDYDIHGNVKTLIQDNPDLGDLADLDGQRFKRMDYVYDLVSGNVHRVDFQTGMKDQWHHAYTYDADNRITSVFTNSSTPYCRTTASIGSLSLEPTLNPNWDQEAAYEYYDHGPLARVMLGEEEVQGTDYVYTLQGWIKGVNSTELNPEYDPGKDGSVTSVYHAQVAQDVMSYNLHYFTGDYLPIVAGNTTFIADASSSDLTDPLYSADMYNGNIAHMATTIIEPDTRHVFPLGTRYRYDQLNRLKSAQSFTDLSGNVWSTGGTNIYGNYFAYDANGNITGQLREDETGTTIDSLTYKYHKLSNGKTIRNRLYHVDESILDGDFPGDIDDMGDFENGPSINTDNNYSYDQEGRLVKDVQEKIETIVWRVDGKVKSIIRPTSSDLENIAFDYDAMGHRIAKHVYTSADVLKKSTYYILDAQGNVMSTYERKIEESSITYAQKEKYIYGSSRLGILNEAIDLLGSRDDITQPSNGVLDLSSITTVSVGGLCSSTAQWHYEIPNTTGSTTGTELTFTNTETTSPIISTQFAADVIPGESYTISFDWLGSVNIASIGYEVRNCSSSEVYLQREIHEVGPYTATFTVPSGDIGKVRIKWFGYQGTEASNSITMGNIVLNGAGHQFVSSASSEEDVVVEHVIGKRNYELSNHLGNVLAVISDKPIPHNDGSGNADYYLADIRQSSDYSPFGVQLSGRNFTLTNAKEYRMGFQGQEEDDEVKGEGNSVNYTYRMHDPRLGRFFAVDPLSGYFPWNSPYAFSENMVIERPELEGLESAKRAQLYNGWSYVPPNGPYESKKVVPQGEGSKAVTIYHSIPKSTNAAEKAKPKVVTPKPNVQEPLLMTANQMDQANQSAGAAAGGAGDEGIVPVLIIDEGYAAQEWEADHIRRQIGAIHDFLETYNRVLLEGTAMALSGGGAGGFRAIGQGFVRLGLWKGTVSGVINISGQLAGNGGDLGAVDVVSGGLDFAGGFIPNEYLSTTITGSIDATLDWSSDGGFRYIGGGKKHGKSPSEVANDLFFNVAMGNTTNALVKNSKDNEMTGKGADFIFQVFNTAAGNVITEKP